MLLNNQGITEEIKEEFKKYLDRNGNKEYLKPMGHSKSSSQREVYSNMILWNKKNLKLIV